MRSRIAVALVAGALVISSCAPKTVVVPVVTAPRFPEFIEPKVPPSLANIPAAANQERAWQFLQAGDLRSADREVGFALKLSPGFYPAETTGGYIQLAEKDPRQALTRFDRALSRQNDYAPALVGKADALEALERDADAVEALQAAIVADRSLSDLERRVEVLRFRVAQRDVENARAAARSGNADAAIRAYRLAIDGSPETAFLYREVAAIEREKGDSDAALQDLRKAVTLDPADAGAIAQLGELLEARGETDEAMKAYADALALGPDARVEARRNALRARAEISRLPAQYRSIDAATQVTRGDLAALVGVRLSSLLEVTRPRDVGVITDIRGHWAENWIMASARGGVLDPFDNHTFQPRTVVRRVDLAQAVLRLLAKVAVVAPAQARQWTNARGQFSDITAGHLAYPAASAAVASGIMSVGADRAFSPSRVVSGGEAVEAMERLRLLANIPTVADSAPR